MAIREIDLPGVILKIHQEMGLDNEAGVVVWDAALVLAHYLYRVLKQFRGKRVVELGGGTGVVGLALGALCADAHVVITDIPALMPLISKNIKENNAANNVTSEPLMWGQSVSNLNPPLDYILASDIVYQQDTFDDLISTMKALSGPGSKFLIAHERRKGMELFFEKLRKEASFRYVPTDELDPTWQSDDIDVIEGNFCLALANAGYSDSH